jgi:hypothetical protein
MGEPKTEGAGGYAAERKGAVGGLERLHMDKAM